MPGLMPATLLSEDAGSPPCVNTLLTAKSAELSRSVLARSKTSSPGPPLPSSVHNNTSAAAGAAGLGDANSRLEFGLAGAKVMVTGAGSGIGLQIARSFADAGCVVWICDTNPAVIDQVLEQEQKLLQADEDKMTTTFNPLAGGCVCDVSSEAAVAKLFGETLKNCPRMQGDLHILVNCAGTSGPTARVEDVKVNDWNACLGVNLNGTFLMSQHGVKMMRATMGRMLSTSEQSGGATTDEVGSSDGSESLVAASTSSTTSAKTSKKFLVSSKLPPHGSPFAIINISSTAGLYGYANRTPYCSAKWAIIGFTKSLALELGAPEKTALSCSADVEDRAKAEAERKEGGFPPLPIRCNVICPGSVNNARMSGVVERDAKHAGLTQAEIWR